MVWVVWWSGAICGGMPARDRADAADARDAWADGGSSVGVLRGMRRALPWRCSAAGCWRLLWHAPNAWGVACAALVAGGVRPDAADILAPCAAVCNAGGAESAPKRVYARLPVRGSIVSIEMISPVLCADGARAGMSSSTSAAAGGTGLLGLGVTARHDARVLLCWGTRTGCRRRFCGQAARCTVCVQDGI